VSWTLKMLSFPTSSNKRMAAMSPFTAPLSVVKSTRKFCHTAVFAFVFKLIRAIGTYFWFCVTCGGAKSSMKIFIVLMVGPIPLAGVVIGMLVVDTEWIPSLAVNAPIVKLVGAWILKANKSLNAAVGSTSTVIQYVVCCAVINSYPGLPMFGSFSAMTAVPPAS